MFTSGLLCVSTSKGEANWQIKVFSFFITKTKNNQQIKTCSKMTKWTFQDNLHCKCQHLQITLLSRILSFHLSLMPRKRFHLGDVNFCLKQTTITAERSSQEIGQTCRPKTCIEIAWLSWCQWTVVAVRS